MKKETWHWTRHGELSKKITQLVFLVSKICQRTQNEFVELFDNSPLALDIYADSEDDIVVKINDESADPDIVSDYMLFSSYGTPCETLSRDIPKKYINKIKDLLNTAKRFANYLIKPCCKKAKQDAARIFVGSKASDIKNCPWCGTFCR